jgi:transposase InsO family protein
LSRREYSPPKDEPSTASIQPQIYNIEGVDTLKEYHFQYPLDNLQSVYVPTVSMVKTTQPVNVFQECLRADQTYQEIQPLEHFQQIMATDTVDLKSLQETDDQLGTYIQYIRDGILPTDSKSARKTILETQDFIIDENGLLFHIYYPRGKGQKSERIIKQLAVPKSLRNDVLLSYHDALTGGHQGMERTYHAIRLKYFWPRMYSDIKYYCKSCLDCQESKRYHHGKKAPLHPIPVGGPFSRLHMDFLELTKTKDGYHYVLLITDAFSKWVEGFPLKTMESSEVAKVLYSEIFCRYGACRTLVTDRAQNFMSKLVKELCKIFQVTKVETSSYHAQSDGLVERMNSSLISALRKYCTPDQQNWPSLLPSILMAYRMTPSTQSTKYSPYFLLFGREPQMPLDVALIPPVNMSNTAEKHLQEILTNHETAQNIAQDNIREAQRKYTQQYDKCTKDPNYKPGDRVWLLSTRVKKGLKPKLCRKYVGPYYICISSTNHVYKLRKCSDNSLVKSMIHANRLKPFIDPELRPTNIPEMFRETQHEMNPEEIPEDQLHQEDDNAAQEATDRGTQQVTQQRITESQNIDKLIKTANIRGVRHYLVRWKGQGKTQEHMGTQYKNSRPTSSRLPHT